jgi:hypothetical protein
MNKTLHIIPGYKENTKEKPYQKIAEIAKEKGYSISFVDIDWNKKLTEQFFETNENDVIFGFSLGAILGRLVAQDYESGHLIMASMTQLSCFKNGEMRDALVDLLGKEIVNDITNKLKPNHKSKKQTIIYGDKEEEPADILVKDTEHELTDNYIKEISNLL